VVNGENAAGGIGHHAQGGGRVLRRGVDVITLGNHTFRHREIWPYLQERREIIRPANYLPGQPGRGTCVVERDGTSLGVVNLSGNLFMQAGSPALVTSTTRCARFAAPTTSWSTCTRRRPARRSPWAGTWTARSRPWSARTRTCPTADARVLPGGTAYITDVGMTGARGGVIGVRREQSIAVMRTHMPMRYDSADEDPWINAVLIRCPQPGRAEAIEQVLRPAPG
jgi:calcineurin-like phosphoesterase